MGVTVDGDGGFAVNACDVDHQGVAQRLTALTESAGVSFRARVRVCALFQVYKFAVNAVNASTKYLVINGLNVDGKSEIAVNAPSTPSTHAN